MLRTAFSRCKITRKQLWNIGNRHRSIAATIKETRCEVQEAARALQPGTKLHGYTVDKIDEIPELFLTTVSLTHDKTGAKHLHVARDDNNNTFSVSFQTTPMDNTGVPHILEHTVLCGSKKFPVRDPFFKMINRSLATFMNAMTASDWTMYPFSSQNRQDYNNLLSIYLDAVFHPLLREVDFRQEGWRLEYDNIFEKASPIQFKGVVYNEMKGVFSSQQNIFSEAVQNKLLPNHTYGVISGGDPAYIPDLTWQQLHRFHKTHYHPSNARFFTYGNFPLSEHLQYINDNYLQHFDKLSIDTAVPSEPRWSTPREESISCQPDPMAPNPEKQTTLAVNFLLSDITDVEEAAILSIISTLLTDGELSPFYQALLEANIGSDYAPVVGYNGYTKESSFSVGLQGIHEDDVDRVKQLIDQTIDKVIEEGFEESRVEALLHRIELSTKHQSSNFGLGIVMSIISGWSHGGNAAELLKVNEMVTKFKQLMADDPKFLQKKVKQYLKDNPHRLTLVMTPEDEFEEKRNEQEEQKLKSLVEKLNEQDKECIYKQGLELHEKQNQVEDMSCLPCITVDQMDKLIVPEHVELTVLDGVPVQYSVQPTNEIVYMRMVSFLDAVPEELKPYVPLFTNVITRMGAGVYDYKELAHQVELHTGGLGAGTIVSSDPADPYAFDQGVLFSSHCLERNMGKMLELWTEVFNRPDMKDHNRLNTLIRMSAAELASSLANMGHRYAMTHSASTLTPASRLSEQFTGLTQVSVMKKIAENEDNDKIVEHLVEIGRTLLNRNNLKVSVNATPAFMPTALSNVDSFLSTLQTSRKPEQIIIQDHHTHAKKFVPSPQKTQIELPFSVNYMSKSVQTVPYSHQDFSKLRVLSGMLTWKFLHREIREKGGAYGGGATCSNGIFSFYSYRDPNSMATLEAFEKSIDWAAGGNFTESDMNESKITVFQQTDKPVPPGSVGSTLFTSNLSDEMRQQARDRLFAVTKDQLVEAANSYLVGGKRPASLSFLGPNNTAVEEDKEWKIIKA